MHSIDYSTIQAIRKNVSKLISLGEFKGQAEFARHCGISQQTVNKIFNNDEEVPNIKTIVKIAQSNNLPSWVMLMEEFPISSIGKRPLKSFSPEGYQLLKYFEGSTDRTKDAILAQAAFFLKNDEHKEKEANALMDARASYKTTT